jgi:hypothetical protein
MPNWCYNSISISGDAENIGMIAEIIADTNRKKTNESNTSLHFKNLVGIPRNMNAETYEIEWYDTNINYWGTKWDVDDLGEDVDEEYIHLSFDTAWSPPVGFCSLLSKIYNVDVEIFYYEGGCDFCGKAIFKDGEQIEDNCYKYREGMYILDKDMFWSEIENDIEYGIQNALEECDIEEEDALIPENKEKVLKQIYEELDSQFGEIASAEDVAEIKRMFTDEFESNLASLIATSKKIEEYRQNQTN